MWAVSYKKSIQNAQKRFIRHMSITKESAYLLSTILLDSFLSLQHCWLNPCWFFSVAKWIQNNIVLKMNEVKLRKKVQSESLHDKNVLTKHFIEYIGFFFHWKYKWLFKRLHKMKSFQQLETIHVLTKKISWILDSI